MRYKRAPKNNGTTTTIGQITTKYPVEQIVNFNSFILMMKRRTTIDNIAVGCTQL